MRWCYPRAGRAPQTVQQPRVGAGQPTLGPVTLLFEIGPSGRPGSIRFQEPTSAFVNADVGPALAASQFPAVAHTGCAITYTPRVEPFSSAPLEDLISYSITPLSGPLPPEGWARIKAGGDCFNPPRPQTLARMFPDFRKIPATPGVKDWVMIGYDTNASGEPINVHQVSSTGNEVLEAQAAKAARQSRFARGARSGCRYPYWRSPASVPAPPLPAENAFRSAEASCAEEKRWATPLNLRFPAAYRRRKIEGWAIVAYDTAPWGGVGNIKVLRAEPSVDFGLQAVQIVQTAKVLPSPQGSTGCVTRIKFMLAADDASTSKDDTYLDAD